MTTDDLLRNLGIADSQLRALRRDLAGEDATKRIDAVLHVVATIREHVELEGQELEPTDGQLELGDEA
jgi:hypothetical protein